MSGHGKVIVIDNKQQWDAEMANAAGKLVVVDFFATWCGPCRMMAPKFVAFSEKYTDVVFFKVDVDKAGDLSAEYGISSIPAFFFFKDGKKLEEVIGASNKLETLIEKYRA